MSKGLDAQSTPSKRPWEAGIKIQRTLKRKFLGSVLNM